MNTNNDENKEISVQSIARAASILQSISEGATTITEIAERCHLSKSTAHRLLQALIEVNLVTRDPIKHQYYLGYLITHLMAKPEITQEYLVACARSEVERLSEFTGETVSFGIMVALRYVNLLSIPSKYDLRVVEQPQKMGSIYTGASGRVLLSQLSDKELKTAIKCMNLFSNSVYTVIDKDKLLDHIKSIQKRGYDIGSDERATGAMCMAAPVRNYDLPATIYILGPEMRIKPRKTEYMNYLLKSAENISNNIKLVFPV